MRLSQVGVSPGQLNAIFFTHMHSDHTEGFADIIQLRWQANSTGPKIDVVCSSDAISPLGFTISCKKFVMHIGDAFLHWVKSRRAAPMTRHVSKVDQPN